MKQIFAVAFVLCVILFACVKGTSPVTATNTTCTDSSQASEQPQILAFLATDSLQFTKDTSGVYYHIDTPGTGNSATANSTIAFTYSAFLLDGTELGYATTPMESALSSTITGFVSMARYFKLGTHILMVIPSSLAYGCTGLTSGNAVVIPPNAVIYYDVTIAYIQ